MGKLEDEVTKLINAEVIGSDEAILAELAADEGEGIDVSAVDFSVVLLKKVNGIEAAVKRIAREIDGMTAN